MEIVDTSPIQSTDEFLHLHRRVAELERQLAEALAVKDAQIEEGARSNTKTRPEDGAFIGAMGTLIDVTDQKLMEETLQDREDLFRSLVDYMHDAMIILSWDGTILFANRAAARIMECESAEELIGHNMVEYIHADSLQKATEDIETVQSGKMGYLSEYQLWTVMGRHIWVESLGGKIMFRRATANLACIRDISKRKQAEEELRESEARYRAISEYSHQAICIVDEQGKITWGNNKLLALGGYSREQLYGAESFAGFIAPESIEFVIANFHKVLAGEPYEHHYTFHFVRGDGEKRLCEKYMMDFRNKHGKRNLIISMMDITDSQQAAAERRIMESQLFQAQKMEAIGTLSGGIAHDFNNVISAMIGYTEMAMMEDDEKNRQDDLKQVLQACERASSLVSQILTFSRKSDVDKKPVNIGYIVKEAVKLLRATIPTTIEIKQHIDSRSMIVLANHTQIHQIIMNLCTNAAHAMRDKGGVIDIKLTPFEIALDSPLISLELTPGSYLKFEISDTGHGIDPVVMKRIFDPFFTTKGISEGTGLGLSVVYGIVKGHGGAITVDSIPGSGSTFTLYFPALQHQEAKEEIVSQEIHRGNEAVLFVDDEPMLSVLGRGMLQKSGYKVTAFTDSVQALEMFRDNPDAYELLITDMAMPRITGIDLAREIWKIRPEMPVILCTGYSDLIDEEKAKQEGVRRFIMKPLRHRELARAIRDVLDEQKRSKLSE